MDAETTVVRYVLRGERVCLSDESGGSFPEDGIVVTFTSGAPTCCVDHTYYLRLSAITAAIDARAGASLRVNAGDDHAV